MKLKRIVTLALVCVIFVGLLPITAPTAHAAGMDDVLNGGIWWEFATPSYGTDSITITADKVLPGSGAATTGRLYAFRYYDPVDWVDNDTSYAGLYGDGGDIYLSGDMLDDRINVTQDVTKYGVPFDRSVYLKSGQYWSDPTGLLTRYPQEYIGSNNVGNIYTASPGKTTYFTDANVADSIKIYMSASLACAFITFCRGRNLTESSMAELSSTYFEQKLFVSMRSSSNPIKLYEAVAFSGRSFGYNQYIELRYNDQTHLMTFSYVAPGLTGTSWYFNSGDYSVDMFLDDTFGSATMDAVEAAVGGTNSNVTLEQKKLIVFLAKIGYFEYSDTVHQLLKTEQQKKQEEWSASVEFAGEKPNRADISYEFFRSMGVVWNDWISVQNQPKDKFEDAVTQGEQTKITGYTSNLHGPFLATDAKGNPCPVTIDDDGTVHYAGNITTMAQLYSLVTYYPDYWRDKQHYKFDYGATPGKGSEVGILIPTIQQAEKDFNDTLAGNPLYQTSTNIVDRVQSYIWKSEIAFGATFGADISTDTLNAFDLQSMSATLSVICPPDSWIPEGNSPQYYNVYAALLYFTVLQDLPRMVYDIVNVLAPTVAYENKSFAGVRDEIQAIRMLYDYFTLFNDANLWEAWNATEFDVREGIEETKRLSLSDIYDYLVANDAFTQLTDMTNDAILGQPFAYFFHLANSATGTQPELATNLLTGIIASAQFIPMHTNVYDPNTWMELVDTEWLLNYYAKFGYFRKALYIDTNADAAVNFVNTRTRGSLKVATLADLFQEKDIVLYLDDNLYNVDDLADIVGQATSLFSNVNLTWDRLGQDEISDADDTITDVGQLITGIWKVGMPELAKTAERNTYSDRVDMSDDDFDGLLFKFAGTTVDDAQEGGEDGDKTPIYEASASDNDISYYLYPDKVWDTDIGGIMQDENGVPTTHTTEYSPLFAFAVLSAVYRNTSLKNTLNSVLSSNTPVFIASDVAPYVSMDYRTSIYNWMLVRNLESQTTVDYATSLDMEAPLYMDIFGNILTESGYVVIPAASNATLWSNDYTIQTAAFCSMYGDDYYLPVSENAEAEKLNKMLEEYFSKSNGRWVLRTIRTVDGTVDASRLSTASKESLEALANTFGYFVRSTSSYKLTTWEMIVTEVLRGAPIEYIDKQFEGIQTNMTYTRNGLIIADKLETLVNALSKAGQNAAIAIPNPAYIDGIEIIVFFVYKILILAVLVIWMVTIYFDAVGGHIGLRTGAKCIGVVCMVLALIVGVPKIFELTYYQSNKFLLQDETEYLMMLNLEKEANGEEIGVSEVKVPETNTKLYLHLADVDIPWWNLLSSISLSHGYTSLDEMYRDYENQHPLAYSDQATTRNGGIYISTDDLFNSAKISFSPLSNMIYVAADSGVQGQPASYYTPYYYMLKTFVDSLAQWCKTNNAIAYTTKIQRGGELKTFGYCKLYFESEEFMEEGNDFFRMYDVYDVPSPRQYQYPTGGILPTTLDEVRNSQWCPFKDPDVSEKSYIDRIEKLNVFAQEWIANNRGMIGRVSDETFIKCFVLACAMEHNRLFNTERADYLEIQELSNEDLLRLSIADHNDVMANSSMSYARFVYTQGGTVAVYLAAILEMVNFVNSWVKPLVTLLVFLIACCSIFVLKLILRRGNNSVYGYITTILLMCSVNILGSLFTKLSMYIPSTGLSPAVCILIQILVQIAYILIQCKIVSVALKDWRNVGFERHEHAFNKLYIFKKHEHLSRDVDSAGVSAGRGDLERWRNRNLPRRVKA